jgi:hypothetical protein
MERNHPASDNKPGPPPEVRTAGESLVFVLTVADGIHIQRLVLRCDAGGNVWVSIQPGTSGN